MADNQSADFRQPRFTPGRRPNVPPHKSCVALALVSGIAVNCVTRVYAGLPVRWGSAVAVTAAAKRLGMPVPERINVSRVGWAKAPQ